MSTSPDDVAVLEFVDRVFIPQKLAGRPAQYVQQYREAAQWLNRFVAPRTATLADLARATLWNLQRFVIDAGFSVGRARVIKKELSAVAKFAWRLGWLATFETTEDVRPRPSESVTFRDHEPPEGTLARVYRDVLKPKLESRPVVGPRKHKYSWRNRPNSLAAAVDQFDDLLGRYATPADLTDDNLAAFNRSILERGRSPGTYRTYWRNLRHVAGILTPMPPLRSATRKERAPKRPRGQPFRKIVLPPPAPGSIREFYCDVFLPERCIDVSAAHLKALEQAQRYFYDFAGGDVPLAELDNGLAAKFLQWLLASRGQSPQTANNVRARFLAVWRHAVERGRIADMPRVRKLKAHLRAPDAWSETELARIVDAAGKFHYAGRAVRPIGGVPAWKLWRAMLLVILQTALRIGSVLRLEWQDVDFSTGVLTVNAAAIKNRRGMRLKLSADALAALAEILTPARQRIFPFHKGQAGRDRVCAHFTQILIAAEIPPSNAKSYHLMHKLRRSVATCVAAKLGIHAASELLGHESIKQTARYIDTTKIPDKDFSAGLPIVTAAAAVPPAEQALADPQRAIDQAHRLYRAGELDLAGMKARIALTLQLRRIGEPRRIRTRNVGQLATALAAHGAIAKETRDAIHRVLNIANRAAHAIEVNAVEIFDLIGVTEKLIAGEPAAGETDAAK